LENLRLGPLATRGGTLYVATYEEVLKTSATAAATVPWTQASRGLASGYVSGIALESAPDGAMYALQGGRVVKRRGCTWEDSLHLNALNLQLAAAPSGRSIVYAVSPGGYTSNLFVSIDDGESWSALDAPGQVSAMAVDALDPLTVYLGTAGDWDRRAAATIYRSIHGGGSWQRATVELPNRSDYDTRMVAVVRDPTSSSRLYAVTDNQGILRSEDGGATFLPSGPFDPFTHALAVDPLQPSILLAGAENGLYRSEDAGRTWTLVLFNEAVGQIAADSWQGHTTWYAFTYPQGFGWWEPLEERGPGRLVRSVDGGATWESVYPTSPVDGVSTLAVRPGPKATLFAGTRGRSILTLALRGIDTTDAVCALEPTVIDAMPCSPESAVARRMRRRVTRVREQLRSVDALTESEAGRVVEHARHALLREIRSVSRARRGGDVGGRCAQALQDFLRGVLETSWPGMGINTG
jgi:photosystem II stability/assembly factor-like uncharacterized protein